ncbi:MAG: phage tail assembly chaperone [Rhizobiaceae bacterium]|nr:phage tail assembly chaperone [Rhizobiaceae bacterium]MCV0405479.1 phage tail assembly chaperone [Rhizobiaceae bacterium]
MAAAGGGPAPFPWREVMATGLGLLRLSPRDFWAMTPVELAHMAGWTGSARARPARADLDRMMRRFPDR